MKRFCLFMALLVSVLVMSCASTKYVSQTQVDDEVAYNKWANVLQTCATTPAKTQTGSGTEETPSYTHSTPGTQTSADKTEQPPGTPQRKP